MSFKNAVKKMVYTATVTILALSTAMSAYAYEGMCRVTGGVVNIRSGESTAYSVVTTVSKNEELNIVKKGDTWTKVSLSNGKEGFIINEYIEILDNKEGTVTGGAVNIRKTPGTDGEIIGLAYKGDKLPILGKESEWVNVKFQNQSGWISAQYISDAVIEAVATNKNATMGQKIVDEAMKHVGKPYVYGASGPSAFDCSGFTSYVYKQLGYSINRTAASQNSNGVFVSKSNLQPGDIVLFTDRGYSGIGHAGIYIGNNQFVHAGNASTGVIVSSLSSSYYSTRFVAGRRIV